MPIQIFPQASLSWTRRLTHLPPMSRVFARALAVTPGRPSRLSPDTRIQQGRIQCKGIQISKARQNRYNHVCQFQGDQLSPTLIQTLFIPLLGSYISGPLFPITPLGLIQTGQSIAQHRRVAPGEKMDLSCSLLDMGQMEKGIRTRFYTEVKIQKELVWQGISTYFTPTGQGQKRQRKKESPLPLKERICLPEDTGRRYAKASGDMNPHHLWVPTARIFGFKRPIAHGMWSLGRSFSSLAKTFDPAFPLYLDAGFKLPAFMPGTLNLGHGKRCSPSPGSTLVEFELRDAATGRPHLKGGLKFPQTA